MLHIIQNDPEVPPGTLVDELYTPYAVHHPYLGNGLPELQQVSALIVLGGTMGAYDDKLHPFLVELKQLIRQAVAARVPYLGICLGGQLLAAAHGAAVVRGRWGEIGNRSVELNDEGRKDLLFRGIPPHPGVFQWHHDSFDIPEGGVLLASSADCPHQAFRIGDAAWGIQFHPEVTEETVRRWSVLDGAAPAKTEELVATFKAESESCRSTMSRLMKNFLVTLHPTR